MLKILSDKKIGILVTAVIIIAGSFFYFAYGGMGMSAPSSRLFENIELKAAFTENGELKVFALANNNALATYRAYSGKPLPEKDSVVIGFAEADMMRREGMFEKPGDILEDFFGIETKVEGVLKPTGSFIDDFHFLDSMQFSRIEGDKARLYVNISTADSMPKLFFFLRVGEISPLKIELRQGSIEDYRIKEIDGKTYYPVVLGSKEADMMISEGLFKKAGDTIEGFFGKDVFIAGIMKETGSASDMMHILPIQKEKF